MTRMHSSRMRTAHFNGHLHGGGGGCACPVECMSGMCPGEGVQGVSREVGVCPGGYVRQGGVSMGCVSRRCIPPAQLHAGIHTPAQLHAGIHLLPNYVLGHIPPWTE